MCSSDLIAEIVAHLADAELAMGWRLRNMLANPGVALTWWDQAVWAERLGYAQQDASLSAGVFRALRESNLRLLESVPRARWVECYGVHEVRGRQTLRGARSRLRRNTAARAPWIRRSGSSDRRSEEIRKS